jgi:hypothetical protein
MPSPGRTSICMSHLADGYPRRWMPIRGWREMTTSVAVWTHEA